MTKVESILVNQASKFNPHSSSKVNDAELRAYVDSSIKECNNRLSESVSKITDLLQRVVKAQKAIQMIVAPTVSGAATVTASEVSPSPLPPLEMKNLCVTREKRTSRPATARSKTVSNF